MARMQFPQKLADYLAAGRPVIVSDVGDQAEIVRDNDLGLVFEADNPGSLTQAIATLAGRNQHDLSEYGVRAHTFVRNVLSPAAHRDRLLGVYRAVTEQISPS